jgi:hypothetical protein
MVFAKVTDRKKRNEKQFLRHRFPALFYLVIGRRSIGSSLFCSFTSMNVLKHAQYWAGKRPHILKQMKEMTSSPNNPLPATDEISHFVTWMFVMSVKPFENSMGSLYHLLYKLFWPPLWSSGQSSWLLIQRFRVRFPALPDFFLRSTGSGTGSTQPREDNWGAIWKESSGSGLENRN